MDLRSLLQDVLSEVSSKVISFQIELHLLITWFKGSGLFQEYRIFEDMRHGITTEPWSAKILFEEAQNSITLLPRSSGKIFRKNQCRNCLNICKHSCRSAVVLT